MSKKEKSLVCSNCGITEETGCIERKYEVCKVMEKETRKKYIGYKCYNCENVFKRKG